MSPDYRGDRLPEGNQIDGSLGPCSVQRGGNHCA
jgi:hypothetical protein